MLRPNILVRRQEGGTELLPAAKVPDVREAGAQPRTSLTDAVTVQTLAAFDQRAAVRGA
jgi:hypothetical protein